MSYTIEQKEEVIRFYLNNGNDAKITCEKLGYPSYETLLGWVKNALGSSIPSRKIRYTPEQKAYAIKYYLENGNNASKTVRDIGYPSLSLFFRWLSEDVPNAIMKGNMVRYTEEQKKYAVEYYINCSRNIARTIEAIGYPTAGTLSKWIAKYSPVPKTNLVRKVNSSVALSNVKENLNATFVPQNIISIKQEKVIDLPADDPDDISISKRRTSVNNYQEVQEVKQEELRSEILYDRSISNYKALTDMLNLRASENFWTWRRVRDIIAELEAKNCSHISNLSSVTIGKILAEIAAKYKQVKSKTIRGCKWYFLPPLLDQETRENKSTRISQALRNEDLRHIEHIRMMKKQIQELNEELQHVRMEKDALEIAAQIIKKDMGISLDNLSNYEKTIVIDALREKYGLKKLLQLLNMAKSSYCYQKQIQRHPDKYLNLRREIKTIFNNNYKCYGYRRIHETLARTGTVISEKVVRRLMKEEQLFHAEKNTSHTKVK